MVRRIMDPTMFSGYGVRTLSTTSFYAAPAALFMIGAGCPLLVT